jgi:6-phosphogluconolactonase
MNILSKFSSRELLDSKLAQSVTDILSKAITDNGKASLAVSGGSTPKGFFAILSKSNIDWSKVTVTLADERWVGADSEASNTRLVHENLLQNNAQQANFFHLKEGESLSEEILESLNNAAKNKLLPLDVLILGMGEDGHTASLFPCSEQITNGLAIDNPNALIAVQPKTAPHQRISFSFASLIQSKNVFLHLCGENKYTVLNKALNANDQLEMPIRAFLQHPSLEVNTFWAP